MGTSNVPVPRKTKKPATAVTVVRTIETAGPFSLLLGDVSKEDSNADDVVGAQSYLESD